MALKKFARRDVILPAVVFLIIAMTANAFDEDRQKALSVGMDAHLAKPVDVERLFGTLRNVIR